MRKLSLILLLSGIVAFLFVLYLYDRGISTTDPKNSAWVGETASMEKTLEVKGHRLRLLDHGKGIPLVLLHGWCDSTFTWSRVFEPLSKRYRVIAFDWPGFGYSSKPDTAVPYPEMASVLAGVLDELKIERAVIIGNSMGGGASMQFAADYPERVLALIPVDAAVPMDTSQSSWVIKLLSIDFINDLSAQVQGRLVYRIGLSSAVRDTGLITDREAEERYLPLNTPGARAFMVRQLVNLKSKPVPWEKIASISAPTLIVWGREDKWIPLEAGQMLQKKINGAQLEILDEVAHMPQVEAPQKFMALIDGFIQRVTMNSQNRGAP